MNHLTVEQILFIHYRIIQETGGVHGVRDQGLLEAAVARPRAGFGAQEFYPGPFEKAAALFDSLIRSHPFLDGNKRTAIAAAGIFLLRNGHRLIASDEDLDAFTMRAADVAQPLDEIEGWLRRHAVPIE